MALPILDGNQTATTLSTVLTSGEHIPAHTVVSLGSVAISNITSAVSGSVVSISNFPASQSTTFGAVTGSVSVLNFPSTQTIAGTVTANVTNPVTIGAIVGPAGGSIFKGISPSVDTIRILPYFAQNGIVNYGELSTSNPFPVSQQGAISGTVTAGNIPIIQEPIADQLCVRIAGAGTDAYVPVQIKDNSGYGVNFDNGNLPISGTVTANISGDVVYTTDPNGLISLKTAIYAQDSSLELQPVGANNPLPISGTVTANNPNGALTTRFGSVTTANTAQITSAVTNTNRKYLLAQNISAGTVTIGIGFSPTTTQGIQLSAGGGLTFDAFCPTGAVYWLGAVTGAAFTILEG